MEGFVEIFANVWEEGFLGIGITEIIVSMLIFIAGAISRAFFVGRVLKWLEKLTANTDSEIDDVLLESLKKPLGYIPMPVALYFITVYLPLSGMADTFATNLVKAMIAFTIFSALANSIAPIFQAFTSSAVLTKSMTMWLERAARIIIWIIGLGIILDIFGIQIGPLVAGLGLFSVAVALGAQDLFKNLISGLLIIGENRFQPGDRIEVPGSSMMGPNGLVSSDDGAWFYVGGWSDRALVRISRGKIPAEVEIIPVGFNVDNVRWGPDGRIIAAGRITRCPTGEECDTSAVRVAKVNPENFEVEQVLDYDGNEFFEMGTVAIDVKDEIWVGGIYGSFAIARFPKRN